MWLFNRNNPEFSIISGQRPVRWATLALLAVAMLTLAACAGFRPLHGQAQGQPSVAALRLAATEIMPIPDRMGQVLHNRLLDLMNPRGRPARPDYRLAVSLSSNTVDTGLAKSSYATRAELRATAQFYLYDAETDKVLLSGAQTIISGYNILSSEYATLVSEQDAQQRAAQELAHSIQNQVAVFFLGPAQQASPK